ncbi:hypothetical protein RHMOL_Rhmol01G0198900 [Rhododendron molle]|uniref:Uncharacterized protein n=1 Tax=Rhododendron molle TaxID=49168 RepID=A0ACC0Q6I0_RHOML|nr:hypothetical protein RHMOL_Rhmol01G0198900 [Rhododendron molle]
MASRPSPCHNWVQADETLLVSVLKSMVESQLWTTGSGHFHLGYTSYLKRFMDSDFPNAGIEEWQIEAKIKKWRRTCFITVDLIDRPGFEWDASENMVVAEDYFGLHSSKLTNKPGRQEMFNFHCLMIDVFASFPIPRSPRSMSRWRKNK